jgi:tripartite-type tricarboxylate transporter receptor subunit TctC
MPVPIVAPRLAPARRPRLARAALLLTALLALSGCAPSSPPSPTAAPKPTEAAKPSAPAPAAAPAASPAAAPAASPAASASDTKALADFFAGKTIRISVGFAPGGGFDAYTRAVARYLGKYIPGNPTVIVENQPGGGSILAANTLFKNAPKDGTALANIGGPIILNQLFATSGVEYDMAKFEYLSVPVPETYALWVRKRTGITKLEEILGPSGKPLILGGIPSSTVEHGASLLHDIAGATNVKVVSGYDGTSKVRLAMDNGEVDGIVNTWQSTKVTNFKDVESGEWIPLLVFSDKPIKDLPASVGKVPLIQEAFKDQDVQRMLMFGTSYPNQFGKIWVAPPGTSADRVAALDEAFFKAMQDKELLADAEKAQLEINPVRGPEIKRLVTEMLNMPADIKAKLQAVMKL